VPCLWTPLNNTQLFFLLSWMARGAGVIPLSVEKKTSEFVNAVFYLGLIAQFVDIDVVTVVTDRCLKISVDSKRFKINNKTDLCVINKNVKLYSDPYHLYKSFF
jgi:hypothetical protein